MIDSELVDEAREVVLQLLALGGVPGGEEWRSLTRIEFGILSWHLGNFYLLGAL